jgi:hypothetical protein
VRETVGRFVAIPVHRNPHVGEGGGKGAEHFLAGAGEIAVTTREARLELKPSVGSKSRSKG